MTKEFTSCCPLSPIESAAADLASRLRKSDPGFEVDEINDALWLMAKGLVSITPKPISPVETEQKREAGDPKNRENPTTIPPESKSTAPEPTTPKREIVAAPPETPKASLRTSSGPGTGTGASGIPLAVPGAKALPGILKLARTLRPLKRRIPSRTQSVLDENLTVERAAEENIILPVLRPAASRWLEVALLIDRSPSMLVWQPTIREFKTMLEREAAFRDVRVWHLEPISSTAGEMADRIAMRAPGNRQIRNPRELFHPEGRRIVLLATDCIGAHWENGVMIRFIESLGERLPLTVLNLLPARLWDRTSVDMGEIIYVSSFDPAAPNRKYKGYPKSPDNDLEAADPEEASPGPTGPPLPIVCIEPEFLGAWARLVAGGTNLRIPAIQFPAKSVSHTTVPTGEPPLLSATERFNRFRSTASTTAFKLACLFAAAPASLPVMRLVQQTMLPHSRQVHLAEVYLGGLLYQTGSAGPDDNPETVPFEFYSGVRKLLLDAGWLSDQRKVLQTVSSYVADYLGSRMNIQAILDDPTSFAGLKAGAAEPFAEVTAEILERLGGDYAKVAEKIRHPETDPVPCHFYADIDQKVQAGNPATITLTISRELITGLPTIETSLVAVDESKSLQLRINYTSTSSTPEDNQLVETDVPQQGAPVIVSLQIQETKSWGDELFIEILQDAKHLGGIHLKRLPAPLPSWYLSPEQVQQFFIAADAHRINPEVISLAVRDPRSSRCAELWDGTMTVQECCERALDLYSAVAPTGFLQIWRKVEQSLHAVASRVDHQKTSYVRAGFSGIIGKAVSTGEAVYAPRVADYSDYQMDEPSTQSEFAFPIAGSQNAAAWGVVNIESDQADFFPVQLRVWLETVTTSLSAHLSKLEKPDSLRRNTEIVMTVREVVDEDTYFYQFILRSEQLDWNHTFHSAHVGSSKQQFVSSVLGHISKINSDWDEDFEQKQKQMRILGHDLWSRLFSAEMKQLLWDAREQICSILLFDNDIGFPLEWVLLTEPGKNLGANSFFLAQLGLVRWRHTSSEFQLPPEILYARPQRCRCIVPEYSRFSLMFGLSDEEAFLMEELFQATREIPDSRAFLSLLENADFDLLHFAGYGEPVGLLLTGNVRDTQDGTEHLPPSEIKRLSTLAKTPQRSMIVLNAGYSDQFANVFLERGCGLFVGVLGVLGDKLPTRFIESLYRELLSGKTLAQAATVARNVLRAARSIDYLSYTVYGNPNAKLVRIRRGLSQAKILWVDDRPTNNIRQIARIREKGAEVTEVVSTKEALQVLMERKPEFDAIISDMGRPEGRTAGLNLLDAIREQGIYLPYVIYAAPGPQFRNQTLARLGQEASNDFSVIERALEQALDERERIQGHLHPERVKALAEYLQKQHLDARLANELNLDPKSVRWGELWSSSRDVDALAVELVSIAMSCEYVQLFEFAGGLTLRAERVAEGLAKYTKASLAGVIGQAAKSGRTVRMDDVDQHPTYINSEPSTKSELAVPVRDPDSDRVMAVFNLEYPWIMAFGPLQIRWLEGLAASLAGRFQLEKPPKVDFKSPGVDPDDRCKGRFGGQPEAFGRRLSARIKLKESTAKNFFSDLTVHSTDGTPLQGPVYFYLHETFLQPTIWITKITGSPGEARVEDVDAYETYTVGAQVKDQSGKWVKLELDLATVPDAKPWLPAGSESPQGQTLDWFETGQSIRPKSGIEFDDPEGGPSQFVTSRGKHLLDLPRHFRVCPQPVTNEAFRRFVADGGYHDPACWRRGGEAAPKSLVTQDKRTFGPSSWASKDSFGTHGPNDPVCGVNWYEARAFVRWMNLRYAQKGWTWILPSEDMWEFAARGPKGLAYPWGNTFRDGLCNCSHAGFGTTTDVRKFPEGRAYYGGWDFAGNVWEHLDSDQAEGQSRTCVLRGGSYKNDPEEVRAYFRLWDAPRSLRAPDFGFRCAQVPR